MSTRTMKFLWVLAGAALFPALTTLAAAQAPARCTVTVKVTGIRNTAGDILIALRTSESTVFRGQTAAIVGDSMTAQAVFNDVPAGTYDVAVVHDENKNGQLDFDPSGMPLEGYGHSNNPEKRPGEPNFVETRFALTPTTAPLEIKLIYWP